MTNVESQTTLYIKLGKPSTTIWSKICQLGTHANLQIQTTSAYIKVTMGSWNISYTLLWQQSAQEATIDSYDSMKYRNNMNECQFKFYRILLRRRNSVSYINLWENLMLPKHKPSRGINKQSPDIVSVPSQFHVFWTCPRIPNTNNLYQTSRSL
jgi:hypothetical protein